MEIKRILKLTLSLFLLLTYSNTLIFAREIKVATYNVQNLFDLVRDGTEYEEYIPEGRFLWNTRTCESKYRNIARVIKDISADIIALQEVETRRALTLLQKRLKIKGLDYPYMDIADSRPTAVKCAILSKFPIVSREEIWVWQNGARNILKVVIEINGKKLIICVNHWKSKRGPESERIPYAKALRHEINQFSPDTDFVLLGDFNSNYNEYITFRHDPELNNTRGITGINHILGTIKNGTLVTEKLLLNSPGNKYLYNLWLEIAAKRRWSYNFFGIKGTPDNIIIPKALYDSNGISYVDNSFDRFVRPYLFKNHGIYRWQRGDRGKGKHLGQGYSDHLPIFARFSTKPFRRGKRSQ